MTDRYDPGLLNDFGGGNVDWWWDYIRAEVERCNDFHAEILEAAVAAARAKGMREAARLYEDETGWQKVCMDQDGKPPCAKPCFGCLINAAEASK